MAEPTADPADAPEPEPPNRWAIAWDSIAAAIDGHPQLKGRDYGRAS